MGKVENKLDNFKKALNRLTEANTVYKKTPADTMYQDSLIKRFEFTFELAWKTLREFLLAQGYELPIASPKNVISFAYGEGFLSDEGLWLDMLEARNSTSHGYDSEISQNIAQNVSTRYIKELKKLCSFIAENS